MNNCYAHGASGLCLYWIAVETLQHMSFVKVVYN